MSWGYVAVGAATLIGGAMSSRSQRKASERISRQGAGGAALQQYQFDELQRMLAPYAEGGEEALATQKALVGLSGEEAQQQAIAQLERSPAFTSLTRQGEEALLQQASATGGLRGGNLQEALAQYRPQLLSQLIQNQFQNLGGLTSVGQSAAAMTGNVGMQTASNISDLLERSAASQAQSQLARADTTTDTLGTLAGLFASYQNRPNKGGF